MKKVVLITCFIIILSLGLCGCGENELTEYRFESATLLNKARTTSSQALFEAVKSKFENTDTITFDGKTITGKKNGNFVLNINVSSNNNYTAQIVDKKLIINYEDDHIAVEIVCVKK